MDTLKDFHKLGIKILQDTKSPKNTLNVAKVVKVKESEQIKDIHDAFVKRVIKDKPPKKDVVEFFQRVIEAEEKSI